MNPETAEADLVRGVSGVDNRVAWGIVMTEFDKPRVIRLLTFPNKKEIRSQCANELYKLAQTHSDSGPRRKEVVDLLTDLMLYHPGLKVDAAGWCLAMLVKQERGS